MELPASPADCKLSAQYMAARPDGSDAGRRPDGVLVPNLKITLTPQDDFVTNTVVPVGIFIETVELQTNDEGLLVDAQGQPDVYVVGNQAYDMEISADGFTTRTRSFFAPAGGEVNLLTVQPIPDDLDEALEAWALVAAETLAYRDEVAAYAANLPTTLPPSGGAGGALGGQYPNPAFNPNAIDQAVAARINESGSATRIAADTHYVTPAAIAAKADLVGGVIPSSQIPALALTSTSSVASQAAMLALNVEPGDIAVRTDGAGTFILTAQPASTLANWTLLTAPGGGGGAVSSVNGQTGIVVLGKGDVGLPLAANLAPADYPVSNAQATVNAAKADLVGGLVPTSQLPSIALTNAVVVASEAAMLALTATQVQPGDIAVRTDGAGTFILTAAPSSTLANWTRLNAPTDLVVSVNGQTGTVVLGKADVGLGLVQNIAPEQMPVSGPQAAAIAAAGSGSGGTAGPTVKNWAYNPSGLGASTFIADPGANNAPAIAISSGNGTHSTGAHMMTSTGSSNSGVVTPVAERFPVVAGDVVTVAADVINGVAASRAFFPGIRWYAADGVTAVGSLIIGADVTVGASAVGKLLLTATAPTGAFFAAFDMRRQSGTGSSTGDVWYLDRLFYGVNLPSGFNPDTGWFFGASTTDSNVTYAFTGTANASPSTKTTIVTTVSNDFKRRLAMSVASPSNTSLTQVGFNLSTIGTATGAGPAATNVHTIHSRLDYLVTTAAATAIAGVRTNGSAFLWQGDGSLPGMGGYRVALRWGPATGVATATQRAFAGVQGGNGTPTDVEPSSRTNVLGMGWDAADTNVQFMSNGASGTAVKVDLGANFPVPTADRTAMYEIELYVPANGTTVEWKVTNLANGASVSGTASGALSIPAAAVLMSPVAVVSAGGTSSVQGLAFASCYIEKSN